MAVDLKKKKPNKIMTHLINICGMRFLNEFALALRPHLLAQLSLPLAVATTNDLSHFGGLLVLRFEVTFPWMRIIVSFSIPLPPFLCFLHIPFCMC